MTKVPKCRSKIVARGCVGCWVHMSNLTGVADLSLPEVVPSGINNDAFVYDAMVLVHSVFSQ